MPLRHLGGTQWAWGSHKFTAKSKAHAMRVVRAILANRGKGKK